ncbi:MAG: hypothetical protein AAB608_02765, partial [Patescibacteria group bacterium]
RSAVFDKIGSSQTVKTHHKHNAPGFRERYGVKNYYVVTLLAVPALAQVLLLASLQMHHKNRRPFYRLLRAPLRVLVRTSFP